MNAMTNEREETGARAQPATPIQTPSYVDRVAVKPPPFWKAEPNIWFVQLESQFQLAQVTADETKYNYVVSAVDAEILAQVSELITSPPPTNKYGTLKAKLTSIYSDSHERRLRRLLSGLELGDKKPTQLLNEMQRLGGAAVTTDLLKTLWLQRLPTFIQSVLATSSDDLKNLAAMADKIAEIEQPRSFAVAADTSRDHELVETIRQLALDVAELKLANQHRCRQPNTHRRNFRPRSRTPARPVSPSTKMCWYHRRFKEDARKCLTPCNFHLHNASASGSVNPQPRQ